MFNLTASQIKELKDIIKEKEKYLDSIEYRNHLICDLKIDTALFHISVKSEKLGMYSLLEAILKNNTF